MIDFHCHLDLYPDPAAIIARCRAAGIYVLSVTTTPKAWRGTLALAKGSPRIRTALGLHPQLAHERIGELALFEGLLPEAKYVGEVGLDGAHEFRAHWKMQIAALERVLRATSRAGGRVMSIHSRRAADDVLDTLQRFPDAGTPVLHWFSGTKRQLERAIDLGCWFSVGPAMLRSKQGAAFAAAMPRDRVLTESDGPFAMQDKQPLLPTDMTLAVTALARFWRDDVAAIEDRLAHNLRLLAALANDRVTADDEASKTQKH